MRPLKFSKKQRRVLTWWRPSSPDSGYDAILCEGAVRSGKTLCTGLSFFCWAMTCFAQKSFALCGKSVPAVRRNLWQELRPILREMGFQIRERLSQNRIDISLGRRRNTFYLFGGLDERSAALVQGITLAGALLDEAALMPRSFVEQVCARCSVEGSRLWFSCNPESPAHWFYQEWVQKAQEKNVLRLSFTMEDNPGLSRETIRRYEAMFQGAFYRRFILGEWAQAEGLIYDFFGPELVDVCTGLASEGRRVIVAGLDMDFEGRPFGPMPALMAVAESVSKVHAVCVRCGNPAQFSHRLSSSKALVQLGETDTYEPLCRRCYMEAVEKERVDS